MNCPHSVLDNFVKNDQWEAMPMKVAVYCVRLLPLIIGLKVPEDEPA